MDGSIWRKSRSISLLIVLTLHAAILALFLSASRTVSVIMPPAHAIEVMLIPPAKTPRVRAENARPERMSTNVAIALAPPTFNSSALSGSSSLPDGHGSAVNWAAEAHRALRAFEIRRDRPPSSAISVSSSLDDWWPGEHHAGDQFKTESGDWIVWINADCYQIASWHSSAIGTSPPRTICTPQKRPARAD
jgi:hypothetical protein